MTEQELTEKLEALGSITDEQRRRVVCSLLGHSKIQTGCFGYFYCARCGDQVGDSLASVYDASDVVIVGHNCPRCRANYEKLGWEDKYLCPDPFAKEVPHA